jgi:hypothetical protein
MRSESEGQSQGLHGKTRQDKRGSQWGRREKHNRGQHKDPSCQQHQETHDFHSEISRFKSKRLAVTFVAQAKISQSHRNPARRCNKNEYCLPSPLREAIAPKDLRSAQHPLCAFVYPYATNKRSG